MSSSSASNSSDESSEALGLDENFVGPASLSTIYKSNYKEGLEKCDDPIELQWKDIVYTVKVKAKEGGGFCKRAPKVDKVILNKVSGSVGPGQLLAVMGASGCGKTSLLNILAGRVQSGEVKGSLKLNGKTLQNYGVGKFKKSAAYVMQDDLMLGYLTVEETLTFAARLRLPNSMSFAEKKARVMAIIQELSLNQAKDTLIGNELVRGVSGGERKRVNIGSELITNPALLFLDEPTTGLDSFTAYNIIETLQSIARTKRAVVCTIHQPNSNIYKLFDNLLLMSEGRVTYFGPAADAVGYFASLSFQCPFASNPADYFLDLITIDRRSDQVEEETHERVYALFDAYEKSPLKALALERGKDGGRLASQSASGKKSNQARPKPDDNEDGGGEGEGEGEGEAGEEEEDGEGEEQQEEEEEEEEQQEKTSKKKSTAVKGSKKAAPSTKKSSKKGASSSSSKKSSKKNHALVNEEEDSDDGDSSREGTLDGLKFSKSDDQVLSFFGQVLVLMQREARNLSRNPLATRFRLFQTIFFALVVTFLYLDLGNGQKSIQDRLGALFFIAVNQSMSSIFGSLMAFLSEKEIFLRENSSGMYRVSSYFTARTCVELPFQLIFPTIFSVIMYWSVGFQPGPDHFFIYLSIIFLTSFCAQSVGFMTSAVAPTLEIANAIAPIFVLILFVFSGFYVTLDNIPAGVRWLQYISFMKYTFEAMVLNEFDKDLVFTCTSEEALPDGTCPVPNGNYTRERLGFQDGKIETNIFVLIGLSVGFRLLAYIVLRFKQPRFGRK